MSNNSGRGRFTIVNYDRAVLNRLAANFIEFPFEELQNRYPEIPSDVKRRLKRNIRQVDIECVDGVGKGGRVPVVWDMPEAMYTKYVLPAIKVSRNGGFDIDSMRRVGTNSGFAYVEPAPEAEKIVFDTPKGPKEGYTEYVKRGKTEPVELSYTIEVRSEYPDISNNMMNYVFNQLYPRGRIPVETTEGEVSYFTIFFDGTDETKDVASVRKAYYGWTLQYRINAEIDAKPDYKLKPVTGFELDSISRQEYEEHKD